MWAVAVASAVAVVGVDPGGYPNGMTGPIRGWRSWNAVTSDVTQSFIERQVSCTTIWHPVSPALACYPHNEHPSSARIQPAWAQMSAALSSRGHRLC